MATIEETLKQDVEGGLSTFDPIPTEGAESLNASIQNLIKGQTTGGVSFDPTLPTVGTQPTLQLGTETDLTPLGEITPIERPGLDVKGVEPVSLGLDFTPSELQARQDLIQGVRTGTSARGLTASAAGAREEFKALGEFEQNILDRRFAQERALTSEQLAISAQEFGQETVAAQLNISVDELNARIREGREQVELGRGQFGIAKGSVEFNALLSSEAAKFGQESSLFTAQVQQAATQSGIANDLLNRQITSIELGLKEQGIAFNQQLSTFTANLGATLGNRDSALNFIKFISDRDFKNADLELQKKQISAANRNALIGAVGNIVGFGAGAFLGSQTGSALIASIFD